MKKSYIYSLSLLVITSVLLPFTAQSQEVDQNQDKEISLTNEEQNQSEITFPEITSEKNIIAFPLQEECAQPDLRHGIIAGIITASSNLIVNNIGNLGFGISYLDVKPSNWTKALTFKYWEFDENAFAMNQFGHPYQGSQYFSSARANGFGFYTSFLYALGGSFMWENFMETSYPSINDIITTPVAGSILGETLHRLYRATDYKAPWITWIICPADAATYFLTGEKAPKEKGYVTSLSLYSGASICSSSTFNAPCGNFGLNIVYGNLYEKNTTPFDYFTLSAEGNCGYAFSENSGLHYLTKLSIQGSMYSLPLYLKDYWDNSSSVTLGYDVVYGSDINYGFIKAGNLFAGRKEKNGSCIEYKAEAGFDLFGVSENWYLINGEKEYNPRKSRTYDFDSGIYLSSSVVIENINAGKFGFNLSGDFLLNVPGSNSSSYEIKGSEERGFTTSDCFNTYSLTGFANFFWEHKISGDIWFGAADMLYEKIGWYNELDKKSSFSNEAKIYIKYNF